MVCCGANRVLRGTAVWHSPHPSPPSGKLPLPARRLGGARGRVVPEGGHMTLIAVILGLHIPATLADSPTATPQSQGLGGTSWQLVRFQGSDDTALTPDVGTKYTIAFGNDGRVNVRLDCNRGSSAWHSAGP